MLRTNSVLLVTVIQLCHGTSTLNAESGLPPNQFGGAINLGYLDVTKLGPDNKQKFKQICSRAKVNINPPHSRYFSSRFYRFKVRGPNKARLWFRMRERPQGSMFIVLYDAKRSAIKTFKGAANETGQALLSPGQYFLQVRTASNTGHDSDGTNTGQLIVRAIPELAVADSGNTYLEARDLGLVTSSRPIVHKEALTIVAQRNHVDVTQHGVTEIDCPARNTPEINDDQDHFRFRTAQAGKVRIQLSGVGLNGHYKTPQGHRIGFRQSTSFVLSTPGVVQVSARVPTPGIGSAPDLFRTYELTISIDGDGRSQIKPAGSSPTSVQIDRAPPQTGPTIQVTPPRKSRR